MNVYLIAVLVILLGKYLLDLIVDILNLSSFKPQLPREFVGYYDEGKYAASQRYLREKTRFGIIEDTFFTLVILAFILIGGFNLVDEFARQFNQGPIITALIFLDVLMLLFYVLHLPFSIYHTFVIEERYGFNRTTIRTFIFDTVKTVILGAIIGGVVFSFVVWFFMRFPHIGWFLCWIGVTLFELFLIFIAPVVIMPLFNKFIPLEEGELKEAINDYARKQRFFVKDIFKMDASRRTSKSNAFFTGFGRNRRIVLFDTLIEKHTTQELVSILAHEIGHYKKRHILKMFILSSLANGFMFFILSFFINNEGLFSAFRMNHISIYASLVFFGFLYTPIQMVFSIITNVVSRKHEYEADRFCVDTYRNPQAFINALKKLTVDNLSNLTPHPLKVFLYYSHPPVLKRIEAIRKHASYAHI